MSVHRMSRKLLGRVKGFLANLHNCLWLQGLGARSFFGTGIAIVFSVWD